MLNGDGGIYPPVIAGGGRYENRVALESTHGCVCVHSVGTLVMIGTSTPRQFVIEMLNPSVFFARQGNNIVCSVSKVVCSLRFTPHLTHHGCRPYRVS